MAHRNPNFRNACESLERADMEVFKVIEHRTHKVPSNMFCKSFIALLLWYIRSKAKGEDEWCIEQSFTIVCPL